MNRTFDRIVHYDERSRSFPILADVTGKAPRSYTWRCGTTLDQGPDGACVGFAWTHEFAARPIEWPVSASLATEIYHRARQLDDWPGEDYDGTSVLAGAKASLERKYISAYKWAFSLEDLILAVGYAGPAILGLNWHNDMMEVDSRGYVHPTGGIAGGHAILCRGVNLTYKRFTLHNSWGSSWGLSGDCRVSFDDMAALLADDGEACIPLGRTALPV
jgi:hypothetical protein